MTSNAKATGVKPKSIERICIEAHERGEGCTVQIEWTDNTQRRHVDLWESLDPPNYVAVSMAAPRPKPLNAKRLRVRHEDESETK